MSRQTQISVSASRYGGRPLVRWALRLAASVFWGLADMGWALAGSLSRGLVQVRLGLMDLPARMVRGLKAIPDATADLAIGAGLKAFELRWPIVTMASLAGATAIAGQWPSSARSILAPPQQPVQLMSVVAPAAKTAPAPKPGPVALQQALNALSRDYGETVGIAILDTQANWMVDVRGDKAFPQQSVSKLWVALTILDSIDRGAVSLDQGVVLTDADRSVFNQPISYQITADGFPTTVSDLLKRALIESDNAANDKLMGLAGGPGAVRRLLKDKKLDGIALSEDERHLQAHIAGLTWTQDLAPYGAFNAARARLPTAAREAALEAYISHPYDGAQPKAVATALAQLHAGQLLSEGSSAWMLGTLAKTTTGPNRLKGGLPEGWRIAHKTGTGQDFQGASIGINDVGLVTAPDGRTYAIAVFLQKTKRPISERLAFLQSISQALVAQWERDADQAVSPSAKESRSAD